MPDIYGSTGDGFASSGTDSNWNLLRGGAGSSADNNNIRDAAGVVVNREAGKGGGYAYEVRRAFMFFDTSGISVQPSEATLKIRGFSHTSADLIVVKSEAADPIVAAGFNDLAGASTALASTDGSGAGTLAGVSGLTYSSELSTWSTSAYNDFALNSTALADMASLDDFKICVMQYDNDYLDIVPAADGVLGAGNWWTEGPTSLDPYVEYTAGVAAAIDNSVFFGTNF